MDNTMATSSFAAGVPARNPGTSCSGNTWQKGFCAQLSTEGFRMCYNKR